jgi:hypothetical protein
MMQFLLAVFTIAAMWVSQDRDTNRAKYACIIGMCSQPFWYYAVFSQGVADNLGVLAVTIFCTFSWFRGIVNNWLPEITAERIRQKFLKLHIKI